ncbi:MAG: cation-transporting P-type ATPase, partial [Candidatus Micrarchaeia archaeon]
MSKELRSEKGVTDAAKATARAGALDRQRKEELLAYGLDDTEAANRLAKYGPNKLMTKRYNLLKIFLDHFQIPTIVLLFAIIFLLTVDFISALVALAFVLATVTGDVVRDIEIRRAIRDIQERYTSRVVVLRGGVKKTVPASEVVPGDIVFLMPGMRVPADGVIVKGACKVDERIFGKGVVERRKKEHLAEKELPAFGEKESEGEEKENYIAYAGSFVVEGEAIMRVERTGKETKIAFSIFRKEPEKKYMIIEKIENITYKLTDIMLGVAFVILLVLIFYKTSFLVAFSVAAAAAVAGIPQSILLTVRVAFYSSLRRMEGLAIRADDLPERLNKVTVICTEKMKALSRGEPTVGRLWLDKSDCEVGGEG